MERLSQHQASHEHPSWTLSDGQSMNGVNEKRFELVYFWSLCKPFRSGCTTVAPASKRVERHTRLQPWPHLQHHQVVAAVMPSQLMQATFELQVKKRAHCTAAERNITTTHTCCPTTVRVRPLNSREKGMKSKVIISMTRMATAVARMFNVAIVLSPLSHARHTPHRHLPATQTVIRNPDPKKRLSEHKFTYDHSFWSTNTDGACVPATPP